MSILESGLHHVRRVSTTISNEFNFAVVDDIDSFADHLTHHPSSLVQARVLRNMWPVDELDPNKGVEIEHITEYAGVGDDGKDLIIFAEDYPEESWVHANDDEGLQRMRIKSLTTAGHRLKRVHNRIPELPMQLLFGSHILTDDEIIDLDTERRRLNILPFAIQPKVFG